MTLHGMTELSETQLTNGFLKATEKWTPAFAETWSLYKSDDQGRLNLTDAIREFRHLMAGKQSTSTTSSAFSATFQGQNQGTSAKSSRSWPPKCFCGDIHLFKHCPYIHKEARGANFKEKPHIRANMRQQIAKSEKAYNRIANSNSDTGILDGITVKNEILENDSSPKQPITLGNTAIVNAVNAVSHPLYDSIIYDSGASDHVCNKRSRFVTYEPSVDNSCLSTASGSLPIAGYGTIEITAQIGTENRTLHIPKTAYVPDCVTTLISASKLVQFGVRWNQDNDTLVYNGDVVCQLQRLFGVYVMEYNAVPEPSVFTARANQPKTTTATAETFHRRLAHAGPDVIAHLPGEHITVTGQGPSTTDCHTCGLAKAHQLISKRPSQRAFRPLERIHFDLLFGNDSFDGTTCIGHFSDEASKYNWAYLLPNKLQSSLLRMFKHFIHSVERRFAVKGLIIAFRTDQESSIGNDVQRLLTELGIDIEWSATDVKEQNGAAERSGGLQTGKARCIRLDANLPEDLWPECYLAAVYLANRTPTLSLNWDSPLTFLQKYGGKPVRPELSHLRVFGCKAFVLLRGSYAPKQTAKTQARAFAGYLIGYESTNIYRIWDPVTYTVRGYRDVTFNENETYSPTAEIPIAEDIRQLRHVEVPLPDALIDLTDEEEEWLIQLPSQRQPNETGADKAPSSSSGTSPPFLTPPSTRSGTPASSYPTPGNTASTTTPLQPPVVQQNTTIEPITSLEPTTGRDPHITTRSLQSPLDVPQTIPETSLVEGPDNSSSSRPRRAVPRVDYRAKNDPYRAEREEKKASKTPSTANTTLAITSEPPLVMSQRYNNDLTHDLRLAFHLQLPLAFSTAITASRPHRDTLPPPPTSMKALCNHPYAEGFQQAAQAEYNALLSKDTFKIMPTPANVRPIPMKWVFTYKFDEGGYLTKFKARIVVRGDKQDPSDEETYAATLAFRILRFLMALVTAFGLETYQLDAVNAFLNVDMDEVVYCQLPEGYEVPGSCCQLLQALYGLRRSPLLWLRNFSSTLTSLGLVQIPGEPCLFTDNNGIIIFFYVDDIVVLYQPTRRASAMRLIGQLDNEYEMRHIGELQWFLGVRIIRNRQLGKLWLSQLTYINKLAVDHKINTSAKAPSTPLPYEELKPYEGELNPSSYHVYAKAVGSVIYPAPRRPPVINLLPLDLSDDDDDDATPRPPRKTRTYKLEKVQMEQTDVSVRVGNYDLGLMKRWQCNNQRYKNLHGFAFVDLLGDHYDIVRYVTANRDWRLRSFSGGCGAFRSSYTHVQAFLLFVKYL